MDPKNPVTRLFADAFPGWEDLPSACSVLQGMPDGGDHPLELDLVDSIERGGGRDDFIAELSRQHPMHRPHQREHDAGFWRAYVEGCAFAWAREVALLGAPRFVRFDPAGPGAPDLCVDDRDLWIEVKTVGLSKQGQIVEDWLFDKAHDGAIPMVTGTIRPGVPPGLAQKFD